MTQKSLRQQFADTMLEVGRKDENLIVLVGDISHFILQPFAEACPGRYYNVGICEPTIVSMAAGLSKMGFQPVVHTIAPFIIERSFEQIKLDFCYQQLGGNLVTVGSAFDYSNLGCTHHCYNDFALLKTLSNTQIFYPSTSGEFDQLFRQAYKNDKLSLFRLPGTVNSLSFYMEEIRIGQGIKIADGSDITVVVAGPHLDVAVSARSMLSSEGSVEIIYLHTIKPLDLERIRSSILKTKKVLVIEEHMRSGGLGDDILRGMAHLENVKFSSLSIPDKFITHYGTYDDHCERLGFTAEGVMKKIREDLLKL